LISSLCADPDRGGENEHVPGDYLTIMTITGRKEVFGYKHSECKTDDLIGSAEKIY
jgi:hypothetical protein